MAPRALHWSNVHAIAAALEAAHPEVDVLRLRFTELHRWVTQLDGFADDPQKSNEKILEAIQMAWLDERN